jgi:hypothetical protein
MFVSRGTVTGTIRDGEESWKCGGDIETIVGG